MDTIPSELRRLRWIGLLGISKYMVVLYDEGGTPLWGAHRRVHKYAQALEALCRHPAHDFFFFPSQENLNSLFERSVAKNPSLGNPLSQIPFERLRLGDFPTFPSKSAFDLKIFPFLFEDGGLLFFHLLRVNARRFLGVVSFPDTSQPLLYLENKISAVADEAGNIIGYNGLFLSAFGLAGIGGPVQKNLREMVEFSPAFPSANPPQREFRSTETFRWQWEEGPPPFRPADGEGVVTRGPSGWRFQNRSMEDSALFVFNKPLDTDSRDFTLTLTYASNAIPFPNLLWRGLSPGPGVPADAVGYTVTFRRNYDVVFKRSGEIVRSFLRPALPRPGRRILTLSKCGPAYAVVWDGENAGHYADHTPFAEPGQQLIFLQLRPGEELSLQALELLSAPSESPYPLRQGGPALTALSRGPGPEKYFHVTLKDLILAGRNCSLFQFDDMTPLNRDLTAVKRDRDRLAALLGGKTELWGASPLIAKLRSRLEAAARSPLAILIEGETGTGKDVLAGVIHQKSGRSHGPFVKIDCAAIPGELMENELFGHEKGAFTGAVAAAPGKFESANGGAVFLDEISSLPLPLQAKLLNVLQDFKVFRVGGATPIHLDLRIISASNIPLKMLVAQGRFREDLYYRLNQVTFALPPLREREEDLPLLAEYFLEEANTLYGKKIDGFAPAALEKICRAPWRGNIRELRSTILRAALFCDSGCLEPGQIELEPVAGADSPPTRKKRTDPAHFKSLLEKHGGNVTQACREAGISRFTAYYMLKKYGFELTHFRKSPSAF